MNPVDAAHLAQALAAQLAPLQCTVRINRNRRVLLSLRHRRPHGLTVSIHHDLLGHPLAVADIPAWISSRGQRMTPALRDTLSQVFHERRRHDQPLPSPDLPTLNGPCDLAAMFERVHSTWFAHLPKPLASWSRSSPNRRLRHIRFGCYRRRPQPEIQLNPRLDQPWVAVTFIEHVLFHECCHHAQACAPIRGETAHSRRFRSWEQSFPQHQVSLAWERANLTRLLAPLA